LLEVDSSRLALHFPACRARRLTVDASGLSFLDSASVRVLVLAARALRGRHGTLVLARPQPVVTRLLEITGADRLLDVRELARLGVTFGRVLPALCLTRSDAAISEERP